MHISEGVLSVPVLATGWAVTTLLLTLSLKRTTSQMLPKMAVFASAFFLASLIRVPIGPGSAHFALLGLMGITLGFGAVPAIFLSLALQAILFQFGGLIALGINCANMSLPALIGYGIFWMIKDQQNWQYKTGSFLSGFLAIVLASFFMYISLVLSNAALELSMRILLFAALPLALLEGVITLFAAMFFQKVAPDLLCSSATK